jgi:mannose-6-phosphate isomerase-like protein (cupin superfamily)
VLFSAVIAVTVLSYSAHVWATTANLFKATTIATGTFDEFEVFNHSVLPNTTGDADGDRDDRAVWLSMQKTKGLSDLYVQSNAWLVGGTTGWHTHPGHSLIIVTGGTITEYDADCNRHVYTFVPGQPAPTLVDPGHGHVHIIRNEGSIPASTIAVQLVPYDPNKANRRIDVPTVPPNCPNIR